jgi:hypothetical protein
LRHPPQIIGSETHLFTPYSFLLVPLNSWHSVFSSWPTPNCPLLSPFSIPWQKEGPSLSINKSNLPFYLARRITLGLLLTQFHRSLCSPHLSFSWQIHSPLLHLNSSMPNLTINYSHFLLLWAESAPPPSKDAPTPYTETRSSFSCVHQQEDPLPHILSVGSDKACLGGILLDHPDPPSSPSLPCAIFGKILPLFRSCVPCAGAALYFLAELAFLVHICWCMIWFDPLFLNCLSYSGSIFASVSCYVTCVVLCLYAI